MVSAHLRYLTDEAGWRPKYPECPLCALFSDCVATAGPPPPSSVFVVTRRRSQTCISSLRRSMSHQSFLFLRQTHWSRSLCVHQFLFTPTPPTHALWFYSSYLHDSQYKKNFSRKLCISDLFPLCIQCSIYKQSPKVKNVSCSQSSLFWFVHQSKTKDIQFNIRVLPRNFYYSGALSARGSREGVWLAPPLLLMGSRRS